LGSTPIEKLRPMQIDTAMNNISERHGGRTAGLCFANLRAALNSAKRDGLIVQNPCNLTSPPKYRKKPVRLLDIDELLAIDAALDGRFAPILRLVIFTGLRISEAVKLGVFDVNIRKREIRVEDSKTESGDRHVPLVDQAVMAVQAAIEQRAIDSSQRPWVDSGRLFTTCTGRPQSARNAQRALDKAVERAIIVGKASHQDFRRAFGSYLALIGEPVTVVQKLLGHKSAQTTQTYYLLANDLAKRATVDRLPYAKGTDEDTKETTRTGEQQRKKRI
jgi:integrase